MIKKILIGFALLFIPFVANAQSIPSSEPLYPEGTVLQREDSFQKYLIFKNQKWKIGSLYTFMQLGVPRDQIIVASDEILEEIPDGEVLRLSPPKVKSSFDMHEHFRAGGNMELYWQVAFRLGISKTLFVPTGAAPDNAGYKEHMTALLEEQKKHPDRVIAFCSIDEGDPEAPKIFEECLDNGGKGVKILGGHPEMYDVPLDNDVMKEVFSIANERDVPVLVHVSIINLPKAKQEFKNLMDLYPDTRVQFAHYCSSIMAGVNLEQCAEFLDAYPNMIIDLSMGGGIKRYFMYMDKNIGKIKDFLLKYQNRIVYGTDIILANRGPSQNKAWIRSRMMCDFSALQEKWFRCPNSNNGEYVLIPGFNFSEEVLQKIFVKNPKRFLKLNELAYPFDALCDKKDPYNYFTCGGQLSELPCDYFVKPPEFFKNLDPQYPTILCGTTEYEGEETSRGVTRIRESISFTGEIVVYVTDYVIFKNEIFELISSADNFKKTFAPIESTDEALAYIEAFHKGSLIFDLAPLLTLRGGTFKVQKSDIKITSVKEDKEGFTINLYSFEGDWPDCIDEVTERVLFLNKNGEITQKSAKLIWESYERPRCIS